MVKEIWAIDGVIVATAIGAMLSETDEDLPSLVAEIVADSAVPPRTAPAVTNPALDTLAIASLDDVQVIARPVSTTPDALATVAAN
jgi:hypothetical protein